MNKYLIDQVELKQNIKCLFEHFILAGDEHFEKIVENIKCLVLATIDDCPVIRKEDENG